MHACSTHPRATPASQAAPRKGKRQPSLSERIVDPATRWQRVVQASRTSWRSGGWIEYAHGTALWYHGGKPIVPILWVLVRYPDGRREPDALLCTDTTASPRDVLDCFSRRWAMEATYEEARAHLGWRHSANGRIPPCSGLRRCCSAFTAQSRCMCTTMPNALPSRHAGPPGIPSQPRPLPMLSLDCVGTSGLNVSSCRPKLPT